MEEIPQEALDKFYESVSSLDIYRYQLVLQAFVGCIYHSKCGRRKCHVKVHLHMFSTHKGMSVDLCTQNSFLALRYSS